MRGSINDEPVTNAVRKDDFFLIRVPCLREFVKMFYNISSVESDKKKICV